MPTADLDVVEEIAADIAERWRHARERGASVETADRRRAGTWLRLRVGRAIVDRHRQHRALDAAGWIVAVNLVHGAARQVEWSVRAALGGSAPRLRRQLNIGFVGVARRH
ncbi:MAG: hypothetical protein ACT4QD_19660 [Acidobacteriota bacterium]